MPNKAFAIAVITGDRLLHLKMFETLGSLTGWYGDLYPDRPKLENKCPQQVKHDDFYVYITEDWVWAEGPKFGPSESESAKTRAGNG